MDKLIEPFTAVFAIMLGVGIVIRGWKWFKGEQKEDVLTLIDKRESEKAKERAQQIEQIVQSAFTGRAEADAHFRAEALNNYKVVVVEALAAHAIDERKYIDDLRDKIAEYHVKTELALQDAKRIALHVSGEYRRVEDQQERQDEALRKLNDRMEKFEVHLQKIEHELERRIA